MAEDRRIRPWWPLLALLVLPVAAGAQRLTDPSKPPGALYMPSPEILKQVTESAGIQENWRLSFVRVADIGGIAIINGRILSPGDTVEGFELLEVRQDGVWGRAYNQKIWLGIAVDLKKVGMTLRRRPEPDG